MRCITPGWHNLDHDDAIYDGDRGDRFTCLASHQVVMIMMMIIMVIIGIIVVIIVVIVVVIIVVIIIIIIIRCVTTITTALPIQQGKEERMKRSNPSYVTKA